MTTNPVATSTIDLARPRAVAIDRTTRETSIRGRLDLDGTGRAAIATGIGFLDHLLEQVVRHGRLDLELACTGDVQVDDHHSAEDCGLALGEAIDRALGARRGIVRFADAHAPLDEALCRCVIDCSGRPGAWVDLGLRREMLGALACENVPHLFRSIAIAARMTLHLDALRGENDHHRAEAAAKAFALALRRAVRIEAADGPVPSTKGVR